MIPLIVTKLARKNKVLGEYLKQSGMSTRPEEFIKKSLFGALNFSLFFTFFIFLMISKKAVNLFWLFVAFPVLYCLFYLYLIQFPHVKAMSRAKKIDSEISSMIRFFIIELNSSGSVIKALGSIAESFEHVGVVSKEILDKVNVGVPLKKALDEAITTSPSEHMRLILSQIANHIYTGSDIVGPLHRNLEDIVEQQKIEFKNYGKKLNALSLFYMIVAIILPTIGFTMLSAGLIFMGVTINIVIILAIWFVLAFMQVMFIMFTSSNRPVVEL